MYFLSSGLTERGNLESTLFFASAICLYTETGSVAKSPEPPAEQNAQPPHPRVPSLFGQVQPEERDSR